jgi:hypothetical protein
LLPVGGCCSPSRPVAAESMPAGSGDGDGHLRTHADCSHSLATRSRAERSDVSAAERSEAFCGSGPRSPDTLSPHARRHRRPHAAGLVNFRTDLPSFQGVTAQVGLLTLWPLAVRYRPGAPHLRRLVSGLTFPRLWSARLHLRCICRANAEQVQSKCSALASSLSARLHFRDSLAAVELDGYGVTAPITARQLGSSASSQTTTGDR